MVERAGGRAAPLESLGVAEVRGVSVLGNYRDGAEDADRFRVVLVELECAGELRIKAGDGRADAKCGTHQTVRPGAGADGATETADPAAGRVLHDAGVDAENGGAGFRTQQIGIGNVQVIAGNIEIEVVLERERNGV